MCEEGQTANPPREFTDCELRHHAMDFALRYPAVDPSGAVTLEKAQRFYAFLKGDQQADV